jgi:hypothetical protein
MAGLKADALEAAQEFATKQGKIAIPLSSNEHPFVMYGPEAYVEVQFRVVAKDDPEARRTNLVPSPDVIIRQDLNNTGDVHAKPESEKNSDLLVQLQRLGDLRKQGILTEEEFQVQKKKLLQ